MVHGETGRGRPACADRVREPMPEMLKLLPEPGDLADGAWSSGALLQCCGGGHLVRTFRPGGGLSSDG
jgi:hypothetical protein